MKINPQPSYLLRSLILFLTLLIPLEGCITTPITTENTAESWDEPIFVAMIDFDPRDEAKSLIAEERYSEAQSYLEYFVSIDDVYKDNIEINELLDHAKIKRASYQYKFDKTYRAVLTGSSDEPYGEAAIMLADFTLIGDVRDVYDETLKRFNGEEIDKLTLSFAGLGMIGTAAPYIKPGLSILKLANRSGKLPSWFTDGVKIALKDKESLKNFQGQIQAIYESYKKIGLDGTLTALSKSENPQQFRSYVELNQLLGKQGSTLIKISGEDGLRILNKFRDQPELLKQASVYGENGIKALDVIPSEKLNRFLKSDAAVRRRMTNFELAMINSGKKTVVNKQVVYQKDSQFDPCFKLTTGANNLYRMQQGLAPIGVDGQPINLHHMKQQKDGLLIETTSSDHKKYHALLHRYTKKSEIDRDTFEDFRQYYWKERATKLPLGTCKI